MSDNTLTVLIVKPMKMPYTRQIPDTLQAMQKIVGGDIEAVYPHDGPVALVCGSEGKSTGMQPNRFLCLENGKPYDVVCGTFFSRRHPRRELRVSDAGADPAVPVHIQPGHGDDTTEQRRKEGA